MCAQDWQTGKTIILESGPQRDKPVHPHFFRHLATMALTAPGLIL